MSINLINSIEREVQTSLEYISEEDSKRFRQELENLKEEKKLLEGKIRGYLTLSDVCHEYKSELKKLQLEYNQLKEKINMKITEENDNTQSYFTEPPTPGHDPGHGIRTDLDQRKMASTIGTTTPTFQKETNTTVKPNIDTRSVSEKNSFSALPRCETPQNDNERFSGVLSTPTRPNLYRESIPMQESMVEVAPEHKFSLSDMGFERVQASSTLTHPGTPQHGDLMVFSSMLSESQKKKESLVIEPNIEVLSIGNSATDEIDEELAKKIQMVINQAVKDKIKSVQDDNKKLRDTIEVLTHTNRELHQKLKDSDSENQQLLEKTKELPAKLDDRRKEGSPQGWVHIDKVSEKSPTNPLKVCSVLQSSAAEIDLDSIIQQNEQLKDANQKWVAEWDKLQDHFEQRTVNLRAEVERLNKALTEASIRNQNKEAEFEQRLLEAKRKAAEFETTKEDLTSQLASAGQREDTLQARIHQLEELVTTLRRDKQTAEAELGVVKQRLTASPLLRTSLPEGQTARQQQELQTEVEVLRQQLLVFQEDFDRERQDRATAQSLRDDLKKKCDQMRKQLRHTEVKLASAETQMKNAEDISRRTLNENEKLQQEILDLKRQLRREQEIREWPGFVNGGARMSPPTRSPPFQYQQPGYGYQQQPQQYIVPSQPQPRFTASNPMMYMNTAGSPPQMMREGYYIGNQGNAGSQLENLPGAWSCNNCTYKNYPGRTVCEMCGYVQTLRQSASQGNFSPLNETLRPRGDEPLQAASQHPGTTRLNTN